MPLGRTLRELEQEYYQAYQEEPNSTREIGPRTRSQANRESFGNWLFADPEPGVLESMRTGPEVPFETRKWTVIDDLFGSEEVDQFPPDNFRTSWPYSQGILFTGQTAVLKAWGCWAGNLGVSKGALRIIDIALACMTLIMSRMDRELRMDQLAPHVKIIVDSFTDKLPIINRPGGYRSVECKTSEPALVKLLYSQVLREGLYMVEEAKDWLRMRSRRTVGENLNLLATIVSRAPIEVSDILRKNAAECLDEIKKLVYVRYVMPNAYERMSFPVQAHVYRDSCKVKYLKFMKTVQGPRGDVEQLSTPDQRDNLEEKFLSLTLERRYAETQREAYCKKVGVEVIAGGAGPITDKSKRSETNIQVALMRMLTESDSESTEGSTSSGETRPSAEWSEYTLPSEVESVQEQQPPVEDLMMPE